MSADKYIENNNSQQCRAIEAQQFDYVDSFLSAPEMRAVTAHISECEKCRSEVEQIRSAEAALASSPLLIPAPGDLYAGFADKLAATQSKALFAHLLRMRYIAPGLAFAALALFFFKPTFVNRNHAAVKLPSNQAIHDSATHNNSEANSNDKRRLAVNSKGTAGQQIDADQLRFAVTNTTTGFDQHAISSNNITLGRLSDAKIRDRRLSRKHPRDIAFALAGESQLTHRNATVEAEGATAKIVTIRDGVSEQLADTTKVQTIQDPVTLNRHENQTDLYASTLEQRKDAEAALGVRAYYELNSEAVHNPEVGFALVVQDDVRGFTAEANNTTSPEIPALRADHAADDGVKVEVEFDEPTGTSSF